MKRRTGGDVYCTSVVVLQKKNSSSMRGIVICTLMNTQYTTKDLNWVSDR